MERVIKMSEVQDSFGAEYNGDVYCSECFDAMVKANSVDPAEITVIDITNIKDYILGDMRPDCAVCKISLGE
jgi:hypothetical protein